jgi:uncharacterized protein (DUF924 family)
MSPRTTFASLAVLSAGAALVPAATGDLASVGRIAAAQPRHPQPSNNVPADAQAVLTFWREAGPGEWFAQKPEFDRAFRERFLALHETAARGALDGWAASADGALALVVLLDQFPRNAFRGTERMYVTDAAALRIADAAVAKGFDQAVAAELRLFLYLPFAHSETLADQYKSVLLNEPLGEPNASHARRHRDIIVRFGRFPHRNPILGRTMTAEEQRYLDEGGFRG